MEMLKGDREVRASNVRWIDVNALLHGMGVALNKSVTGGLERQIRLGSPPAEKAFHGTRVTCGHVLVSE